MNLWVLLLLKPYKRKLDNSQLRDITTLYSCTVHTFFPTTNEKYNHLKTDFFLFGGTVIIPLVLYLNSGLTLEVPMFSNVSFGKSNKALIGGSNSAEKSVRC